MHPDRHLAQQITDQSPDAWAEFVDTYGPRLHRLARRYAPGEAGAEDLTQEIFVALYQSMRSYRGEASLATWAYCIALNYCLKSAAKTRPVTVPYEDAREQSAPDAYSPAVQSARRELLSEIDSALAELSPSHRETVILHDLHEMTYAECAAVLGVPVGTVKSRLSTAFRRLRVVSDSGGGNVVFSSFGYEASNKFSLNSTSASTPISAQFITVRADAGVDYSLEPQPGILLVLCLNL